MPSAGTEFQECRFGTSVAACYHVPRCGWERPVANRAGRGRFGRPVRAVDDTAGMVAALLVAWFGGDVPATDSAGEYARATPVLEGAK
jgi:hypothetical protein